MPSKCPQTGNTDHIFQFTKTCFLTNKGFFPTQSKLTELGFYVCAFEIEGKIPVAQLLECAP